MCAQILTLLNQSPVTVRPVKSNDIPLIVAMHERLSPRTIYQRYLQYWVPPINDFQCLVHLGQGKAGAAFVAVVEQPWEVVIGLAYYVIQPDQQFPDRLIQFRQIVKTTMPQRCDDPALRE